MTGKLATSVARTTSLKRMEPSTDVNGEEESTKLDVLEMVPGVI